MALDTALEQAVCKATEELGQSPAVAKRLTAWLRALSNGEVVAKDNDAYFENVIAEIRIENDNAG